MRNEYSALFFFVLAIIFTIQSVSASSSVFIQSFIETDEKLYIAYNKKTNSQTVLLLNPELSYFNDENIGGPSFLQKENLLIGQNNFSLSKTENIFTQQNIKEREYIVQKGDALSVIADKFNVSIDTIIWENNLSRNTIRPDQKLNILPLTGINYRVKSGETLSRIVEKHDGDLEKTVKYNNILNDEDIFIDQKILVVGGRKVSTVNVTGTSFVKQTTRKVSYGYFSHPVPGAVRTQGLHNGKAIDFGAPIWTPVLAAASGTVKKSSFGTWGGGYGNHIIISHSNGTRTLYAHLIQNNAYGGQYVNKGQIIGYMGSTGRSTGSHLHFEVHGARNPF